MNRRDTLKLLSLAPATAAVSAGSAHAKPGAPLALQFTTRMREIIERISDTQSGVILETAHRAADTVRAGRKCYVSWDMGHRTTYDIFPDRPGDTDIFVKDLPQAAEKGDMVITNAAASEAAVNSLRSLHDKGVFIVGGPRSWGGDCAGSELIVPEIRKLKLRPFADLWIDLMETAYGAVVNVPGSPYPMGPSSGGVGVLSYWMITSDTARLLTGAGMKFNVFGDEPALAPDAPFVATAGPLGGLYADEALARQKAAEGEMDRVVRIAEMAVHTVMRGGRVYSYSRWELYTCAEVYARRGGLGLTYGVYGAPDKLTLFDDPIQQGKLDLRFKPTGKDTVIMGLVKPDGPDDLAALDRFRKAGMRVASIGPATRGGVVPSGRTVPKETDVHAGAGCDTFGLFALPGVQRKICPVSGFAANQLLWMVCVEIAQQIIARTGNVPGIYLNGAMEGGMDRLEEVKSLLRQRGY